MDQLTVETQRGLALGALPFAMGRFNALCNYCYKEETRLNVSHGSRTVLP